MVSALLAGRSYFTLLTLTRALHRVRNCHRSTQALTDMEQLFPDGLRWFILTSYGHFHHCLWYTYYLDNHATDNTLLPTTEWCLATIYQCQWQEQNCIQCFVLRMVARFLSKWASNQLSYIPCPSKFGGVHQRTPVYTSVHGITVAVTIMQGTSLTIMVCYCNLLNFVGFCWTSPDPSD